jgi:hypothetical protein
MGKSNQMFTQMRENDKDQFIDDEYQQQEWQSRERRASPSDTLDITSTLTNLFESFGVMYKDAKNSSLKHIR